MRFSCGSGAIFRLFGVMMLEEKLKLEKCGFRGLETRVLEAKLACCGQFWAGFGQVLRQTFSDAFLMQAGHPRISLELYENRSKKQEAEARLNLI